MHRRRRISYIQEPQAVSDEGGNLVPEMQENKMGVLPVKRLIVTMSLPMMVSMLVQALYNIVDSIFVSQVGEQALTAVSLAFPLQMLMISVGSGTGVGINAMLSKALGEGKFKKADEAANTGLFLMIFSWILFVFIGLFAAGPFLRSQTQNAGIIQDGTTYLRIVCCLSFGLMFQVTFERLLQSTGQTVSSMISQMTGAVINIIFDPILIFGYFGAPKLGVAGAAYATVLGQSVAAVVGLILNVRKNKEIHLSIASVFHPKKEVVGRIYFVGVPSILMMSIGSVMNYLMNQILVGFSDTAAAVFGVYFKMQSFFFMPVFGLNNGLIPVLAYNYGARRKDRIDEALKFSFLLALCILCVGTLSFELFPKQLLSMFNASEKMTDMGVVAMREIGLHFPFASVGIIMGSVFQAFSKSYYSLIISLLRQLVVLVPAAWILATVTNDVNQVWWCFLIAEIVAAILSVFFFRKVYKDVVVPLG